MFGIELLELGDVLVVEEYENFAFGCPEVSLLACTFELAFLEGNVTVGEVSAAGLGAESEFILTVAVVVGTLDGIPAVTGLEDDPDGLAGAGVREQDVPFFFGGHVESIEAGFLGVFKIVEASPVVALGAE